jgi:NADPH2:quinone reductase
MKAIRFQSFGKPEVLELVEVPTPRGAADAAVVRVVSASVNPSDVKNVSGHFPQTTLPRIPGRDFSGVVVDGPAGWIGAEVWGTGGDIGFTRDGTHAQFIQIPAAALSRKPANLSHEHASATGVNFVIAWLGAMEYARLARGETVAIVGIAGGVGGAVAQLAKALGCRVLGLDLHPPTEGSPAARRTDTFLPLDDAAPARVKALTGGGADVVFDAVGGVAFEPALGMVGRRGRVVEISATGRRRVELDLVDFYHNETQLFGADSAKLGVTESASVMTVLAGKFEKGELEPPLLAERFDLDHARGAYEAVAAGTRGRVVITMGTI